MLCTSPAPRVALLLHYRQVWLTLGNFFILSLPKELTTPATHLLVVPPLCRSSPSEPTALLPAPRCTVSKLLLPYLCPSLVASLFPRHVPNPPPPFQFSAISWKLKFLSLGVAIPPTLFPITYTYFSPQSVEVPIMSVYPHSPSLILLQRSIPPPMQHLKQETVAGHPLRLSRPPVEEWLSAGGGHSLTYLVG